MKDLLVTENVPVRDLVLRRLREAILSGLFQPGERLLERQLVDRMGVSRTPIREALRKLELEGLVSTVPYKGPVVTLPTLQEACELYDVRACLERRAVMLFTKRADKAAISPLRDHIKEAEKQYEQQQSTQGVLRANNAFHDAVVAGCGNSLLRSLIENLRNRIVLMRVSSLSHAGRQPQAIADHRAILRMIERRNVVGAGRLVEQHIMHAWQAARAELVSATNREQTRRGTP